MPKKQLTSREKKDIHESLEKRVKKLNQRLDHIARGQTIPKTENYRLNEAKEYELAMVFIDIDNFTKYLMEEDRKWVLYLLGLFVPEAMRLVKEYDGFFEKTTGDGLFAYFGVGKDPDESIADMLEYITTVQWMISNEINPRAEDKGFEPISISSGSTYGTAHVSWFGVKANIQNLNQMTAVSSQANIAYTIEKRANPDEHLVGPGVYHHADETDKEFLELYDVIEEYDWVNPSDEDEWYSIYEYTGEWDDE